MCGLACIVAVLCEVSGSRPSVTSLMVGVFLVAAATVTVMPSKNINKIIDLIVICVNP